MRPTPEAASTRMTCGDGSSTQMHPSVCCIRLLSYVIRPVLFAFPPVSADIANVRRSLKLQAGRIVECLTYCLAIHLPAIAA